MVDNLKPSVTESVEGDSHALDALYETLGAVQAGIDTRGQEAEEAKKKLLEQEQTLLDQRQEAEQEGDHARYDELTAQLDQLRQAWQVLTADDEESADAGTSEHEDGDREQPADGGGSDGDALPGDPG